MRTNSVNTVSFGKKLPAEAVLSLVSETYPNTASIKKAQEAARILTENSRIDEPINKYYLMKTTALRLLSYKPLAKAAKRIQEAEKAGSQELQRIFAQEVKAYSKNGGFIDVEI